MPTWTNPLRRRHPKTEETSTSSSPPSNEKSQTMDGATRDPSSTIVRVQRKVGAMKIPSCFSSKDHRRGHKRLQSESAISEKPRYVHTPQHAADSFMRTTSPIPQYMRPMSDDFSIKTSAQLDEEKRELARQRAAERGRVHVVGTVTK